jgi:ribonuclease HII
LEKLTKKNLETAIASMDIDEAIQWIHSKKASTSLNLESILQKLTKKKEARDKELERLYKMLRFERKAYQDGFLQIAGVDEAGRGPLAGPVVAAAVILPPHPTLIGLNDSKKLSPLKRENLFDEIHHTALSLAVGISTAEEIDETNILYATKNAMKTAVLNLSLTPDMVLVDYENIDGISQEQISIVKGDALSLSIAAASIIAKVTRDRMMVEFSRQYPQYGFDQHKGYGTKEHIQAIKENGICPIHRISFTKNFMPASNP